MPNTLREEDIDPLSLTNLLLRHDYRIGGSGIGWAKNWVKDDRSVTANQIMQYSARLFGTTDDIILEDQPPTPTPTGTPDRVASAEQPQGQVDQQIPERNQINPEMFSTDPEYNPCPAFMSNICRVDGRPCLFTIQDFTECGKRNLAKSADPELMEIPPGREQSFEYQKGQHA